MKNIIGPQGFVSNGPQDGTNYLFIPELKAPDNLPFALIVDGNGKITSAPISSSSTSGSFVGTFSGSLINPQFDLDTWVPKLSFTTGGTCTYLHRTGTYYRIGKLVTAFFDIQLSSKDSVTGSAYIVDLPYTSSNGILTSIAGVVSIGTFHNMATGPSSVVGIGGSIGMNSISASIHGIRSSQADFEQLTDANFTNTSKIAGMITYLTDQLD